MLRVQQTFRCVGGLRLTTGIISPAFGRKVPIAASGVVSQDSDEKAGGHNGLRTRVKIAPRRDGLCRVTIPLLLVEVGINAAV